MPPDALLRARILAVFLWSIIANHAHDAGLERLRMEAVAGLRRVTADLDG